MDEAEIEPPAGFEAVAAEPRARILHALAEYHREHLDDPFVGFAELRRRAGVPDSGNFNYHLDRLLGRFVDRHEEGYLLTSAGMQLVAAMVSGSYEGELSVEPTGLGRDCPICGEPVLAREANGLLVVGCGDGHALSYPVPARVVEEEGVEAAVELLVRRAHADLALAFAGRCPMCSGRVALSVEVQDAEEIAPGFQAVCEACPTTLGLPAAHALLHEPTVAAFFADHGIDVRSDPVAMIALASDEVVAGVAEDPPRITVELERGGETLRGVVDGNADVVDVVRR